MGEVMDSLAEVNYLELQELYNNHSVVVALAHTPTCGTCILAKKMLIVVKETMKQIPIVQINLNYNSKLAMEEEILSVPCLLIFKSSECVEKVYALESVPNLYKKISSYL